MKYGAEAAEFAGTFVLVFAGCGAITVAVLTDAIGTAGIAAVFGLAVATMIYATGHLSGAHFNPAVTLGFAATHHFPWRRVPSYMAAQFAGGIAAAALLSWLLGQDAGLGATAPAEFIGWEQAAAIEVLLTAILMFVISSVATDGRATGMMAGIAIGGTVAMNALWAGPLTGASMNPARSVGPAWVSGMTEGLGLYLLAPALGALLGAFAYEFVRKAPKPSKAR